jgi:23S rRNA pseudouridine1911/1915/1917 synthase
MRWRQHTVTESSNRLDQYLTGLERSLSRTQVNRLIVDGHVRLNGSPARPGSRLRAGDELTWEIPPPSQATLRPEAIDLPVVYEDEDLLVIDKPAGLVVHPGPGHATGTLVNALLARGPRWSSIGGAERPGIVHRLDRDTSGLLVVARNDHAHRDLSRQLQERTMHRSYRAIAVGEVPDAAARIDAAVGRDPKHRQRMAVLARGREAVSDFRRLEISSRHSLLEVNLHSGRTHQVRVHLAYIRHPVLGDAVYGRRSPLIDRPALHAADLRLRHPSTGQALTWHSAPPADFQEAWAALGGSTIP